MCKIFVTKTVHNAQIYELLSNLGKYSKMVSDIYLNINI